MRCFNSPDVVSLIITADDYGYHPSYDEGILEAAAAGAVDSVSAFAPRPGLEPEPLLRTGVEVGLHLDLEDDAANARLEVERQLSAFEQSFSAAPAYLDGHRHCHASEGVDEIVAAIAAERRLPVRSVSPRHRRVLRRHRVVTPALTIGRVEETRPPLPSELRMGVGQLPPVVEWFVHPGYAAGDGFSSFDAGREQDLRVLLRFRAPRGVRRRTHAQALVKP